MRVLAIDFGTSNTVAFIGTPERGSRALLFDGSPLLPSAIYYDTDGKLLSGRDAERNARVDPARFEPNPKRRIDDGELLLGDRQISVAQAFAVILGRVAEEAVRQLGAQPDRVKLTHPAGWGQVRRGILAEAASLAGLPQPELIPEPVAAASYFTAVLGTSVDQGQSLAIYDLGAGTFDATVVRRTGNGFEVLAEGGLDDVGGLDFDNAVIEHLSRGYSEEHQEAFARLRAPKSGADRRYRRMLWEDVRGAKEMLSRTTHADIHLPTIEVDAHFTRAELEELVLPLLERTLDCLRQTIARAKLLPNQLIGIFLVGGSSRIPLAAQLIHRELGVPPTALEQPETVVAEGALRAGAIPSAPAAATLDSSPVPFADPHPSGSQNLPMLAYADAPGNATVDETGALVVSSERLVSPVSYDWPPTQPPSFEVPSKSWLSTPPGVLSLLGVCTLGALLVVLIVVAART